MARASQNRVHLLLQPLQPPPPRGGQRICRARRLDPWAEPPLPEGLRPCREPARAGAANAVISRSESRSVRFHKMNGGKVFAHRRAEPPRELLFRSRGDPLLEAVGGLAVTRVRRCQDTGRSRARRAKRAEAELLVRVEVGTWIRVELEKIRATARDNPPGRADPAPAHLFHAGDGRPFAGVAEGGEDDGGEGGRYHFDSSRRGFSPSRVPRTAALLLPDSRCSLANSRQRKRTCSPGTYDNWNDAVENNA